jgi:AbrB family looped-hinge helix DNA binding protein
MESAMATSTKITRKGQVTIPKKFRDRLGSALVEFEMRGTELVIRPVASVAGSLKKYAKPGTSFQEARNGAWEEVAHERAAKKPARH